MSRVQEEWAKYQAELAENGTGAQAEHGASERARMLDLGELLGHAKNVSTLQAGSLELLQLPCPIQPDALISFYPPTKKLICKCACTDEQIAQALQGMELLYRRDARPLRPAEPLWSNFPAELTVLPQWVLWRYEVRDGKPTKVPCQPDGKLASVTDSATWSPFDFVQTAYLTSGDRFDGVGFVLTGDGIVGFDFDAVKDRAGTIIQHIVKAGAIIDSVVAGYVEQLGSYAEFSPSGEGVRGFAWGKLPGTDRRVGNIELYDNGRYLTVTGRRVPGTPESVRDCQVEIDAVYARVFAERIAKRTASRNEVARAPITLDDTALLEKARAASNGAKFAALYDRGDWGGAGYSSQSEADLALCGMLAFWTGKDTARTDALFRSSALKREKWNRTDYRERTLTEAMNQAGVYESGRQSSGGPMGGAVEIPHNPEAEKAVVGALLQGADTSGTVGQMLTPAHFYDSNLRTVFAAISALSGAVDVVTVAAALKKRDALARVGGETFLRKLAGDARNPDNLVEHARLLREWLVKRNIVKMSHDLMLAGRNGLSVTDAVEQFQHCASELAAGLDAGNPYPGRGMVDAYEAYERYVAEDRHYSVQGLILAGTSALVSALIEGGKSTLLRVLARSWALGLPFLGREVIPGKVAVFASSKEYDAWVETIGLWGLRGLIYIAPSTDAHFGDARKAAIFVEYQMRKFGASYLILDTLFDYLGIPDPKTSGGDSNRLAMNEQAPLLELIRKNGWSLVVSGHQPKGEAQAINPRDPQEAFAGHTGWSAQHRMRISLRRKSQGVITIVSGRGSPGDQGFEKEQLLSYDPKTRMVSLAGDFTSHLGELALPSVLEALQALGGVTSRSQLEGHTGKGKAWILAGLKHGMGLETPKVWKSGRGKATVYWNREPPKEKATQRSFDDERSAD